MSCNHEEAKIVVSRAGDDDEGGVVYICNCNQLIIAVWIGDKEVAFSFKAKSFARALNKLLFGNNGGISA